MTVNSIETLIDLIDEMIGQGMAVVSAWKYTNSMNNKVMFAVFTESQICDIHQSPYVKDSVQIWVEGKFIGEYAHLN